MVTIPTGQAAIGKQVTIGGQLYPSQEWYDVHVLKKGAAKIDTEATKTQIQAGITDVQEQIKTVQAGVGALAEMDSAGSPAINNGADDIVAGGIGATAGGQSTIDQYQKMMDDWNERYEKQQKDLAAQKKGIMDLISKRDTTAAAQKTQAELRTEAQTQIYEEMGITAEQFQQIGPLIGQISAYSQQIATLEAQKTAALAANEQRPGRGLDLMTKEGNRIAKQYNSEIATKAAQAGVSVQHLQMLQGAQADANAMTAQIVNAATYDQRQELADIQWSLDAHQDLYNLMSNEEQTSWNRTYTLARDELDRATTEKTNVNNLMLQYAGAGITIDDTLDEATKKASEWQKATPEVSTQIIGSADTGYSIVTVDKKTGKHISTKPIGAGGVPTVLTGTEAEIDIYAKQLYAGAILPSNVPQKIRGQVLIRQKELTLEDVRSDIMTAKASGTYSTQQQLIDALRPIYKELTTDEITAEVKALFQEPAPEAPTPERAVSAGELAGKTLQFFPEAYTETLKSIKDVVVGGVGGFFKGLFSK